MLIKIGDCWVDPEEIAMITPDLPLEDHYVTEAAKHVCVQLRQGASAWIEATMDEAEAALIDAGAIENLYPEDEGRIKLSEAEREELSALYEQGYEYIARDSDGKANAFKSEPIMGDGFYYPRGSEHAEPVSGAFECLDVIECFYIPFLLSE